MLEDGSIGWVVEEDGVEVWFALEDAVTRKMRRLGGGRRRGVVGVAQDDRSTVAEHYEDTFESLCDQDRVRKS